MQLRANSTGYLGYKTDPTFVLIFPLLSFFMSLFSSGRFSHLFSVYPYLSHFSELDLSYISSKKPYASIKLLLPLSEFLWKRLAFLCILNCIYPLRYTLQANHVTQSSFLSLLCAQCHWMSELGRVVELNCSAPSCNRGNSSVNREVTFMVPWYFLSTSSALWADFVFIKHTFGDQYFVGFPGSSVLTRLV